MPISEARVDPQVVEARIARGLQELAAAAEHLAEITPPEHDLAPDLTRAALAARRLAGPPPSRGNLRALPPLQGLQRPAPIPGQLPLMQIARPR